MLMFSAEALTPILILGLALMTHWIPRARKF